VNFGEEYVFGRTDCYCEWLINHVFKNAELVNAPAGVNGPSSFCQDGQKRVEGIPTLVSRISNVLGNDSK
jgi:hypothetical protein